MKLTPIAIALGAMFISSAAFAAEDFTAVDADGDGQLTLQEARAALPDLTEEQFKAVDKNGDGTLSTDEWTAAMSG